MIDKPVIEDKPVIKPEFIVIVFVEIYPVAFIVRVLRFKLEGKAGG